MNIDHDPVSDTLHLELATELDSSTIVHYTDHPHVALLLDTKTGQAVGFHIEAVSEFINPGIIGKVEELKALALSTVLTREGKGALLEEKYGYNLEPT